MPQQIIIIFSKVYFAKRNHNRINCVLSICFRKVLVRQRDSTLCSIFWRHLSGIFSAVILRCCNYSQPCVRFGCRPFSPRVYSGHSRSLLLAACRRWCSRKCPGRWGWSPEEHARNFCFYTGHLYPYASRSSNSSWPGSFSGQRPTSSSGTCSPRCGRRLPGKRCRQWTASYRLCWILWASFFCYFRHLVGPDTLIIYLLVAARISPLCALAKRVPLCGGFGSAFCCWSSVSRLQGGWHSSSASPGF